MSDAPATVVVLAAGLGSRFGGPKQLEPVGPGGHAILDYTLADATRAGFRRAVVVVRPELEAATARHLRERGAGGVPWRLALQTLDAALPGGATGGAPGGSEEGRAAARGPASRGRTKPWGTAHAALVGAREVDAPFAVANADDHYGAGSWSCLGGWVEEVDGPEAAAVGFRLGDTLSEHGGVSRGLLLCGADGALERIAEATHVRREEDGVVRGTVEGERRTLAADDRISMNLWGFTPGVVPLLEDAFRDFLAAGPGPDDELHLPDAVGRAVAAGRLGARVLPCGEGWAGMTWPGDRPAVRRRLAERGPPPAVGVA